MGAAPPAAAARARCAASAGQQGAVGEGRAARGMRAARGASSRKRHLRARNASATLHFNGFAKGQTPMRRLLVTLAMLPSLAALPAAAAGERVRLTGEAIDTWCYFSGVMGGTDSVVGSAHHTCALWCAAGGIPVGLLADDGAVYMVLKWEGDASVTGGDAVLEVQSDRLVVDGVLHARDGVNYVIVDRVVENLGLVNLTHQDYDVVPPFAIEAPGK